MRLRRARIVAPLTVLLAALAAQPANAAMFQDRLATVTPVSWTPNVQDGVVNALVPVGGQMVAAGGFTQVKRPGSSTILDRTDIFMFNAANGQIDPSFAPDVEGGEIRSAVAMPDGSAVFIGGNFTSVNGVATHLAKIDLPSGQLDPTFQVSLTGTFVNKLALANGKLYLAGSFKQVNGKNRSALAAVDPVSGALDKDSNIKIAVPRMNVRAGVQTGLVVYNFAISPDGSKMVLSGTFTQVGGLVRPQVAMLNLTTSPVSVADWETDKFDHNCSRTYDTYVRGIDFSPAGDYFVIGDTGAYSNGPFDTSNDGSGGAVNQGTLCDSVSRWESNATGSGITPSWVDYTGGDSITQVAVTGSAIYVGGHARWLNNPFGSDFPGAGGIIRTGIAAVDPLNGLPLSWDPSRTRGKGVFALTPTDSGLWVGSDTTTFDGLTRMRIAYVPLAGGEVVPTFSAADVPAGNPANLDPAAIRASFRVVGSDGSDKVYFAAGDGHMYVAPYDDTSGYGSASVLDLHNMLASCVGLHTFFGNCDHDGITIANVIMGFPVARVTSMSYDAANGRIDYTLDRDSRSFYRYFEAEDGIVGTQGFVQP